MRKYGFLFFLFCLYNTVAWAADITFKASAPQAVVVNENFRLSYTVNAEASDLRIPELADFEILSGPNSATSYSTQMINGKVLSETTFTFTYILRPKKEGTFNILPASIKVKGATYSSNALVVKVLPADEAGEANAQNDRASSSIGKDDLFLAIHVAKKSIYEQEGVLVTFKLYADPKKVNIAGINQLKLPEFDGFLSQDIELPQNRQLTLERYGNRNLAAVSIREAILFPQRSGKITIPAGKLEVALRMQSAARRPRSIFDIFEDDGYVDVNKEITSSPVTIDVKPLPGGKPSSFSGTVGDFKMTSSLSTNSVKADEAITLKINITGNGNVKLIKNPEVNFPNDFEVYDPKVETAIQTTSAGSTGTKTIEYMAIPRYAGDFILPAVSFAYFDVKSGTYKTLTTESYQLHVEPGKDGGSNSPVVSNFNNKESVQYIGKDIRYLKVGKAHFVAKNDLFFGSFVYLLSYLIPLILFATFFFIYRKQVKENADLARVRTRKANKMAVKRLKNAGQLLKAQQEEAFYDEILRALWGYLSDKLNIPLSSLTKDNVEAELSNYGVDHVLTKAFMDILNTCEFARYAPGQTADTMDKIYEQTIEAISKMENTIKK